eukprot:1724179-Rhodomonas_salina.3
MTAGITDLDLSGCKLISDKTMCEVVTANTALTSLKLYGLDLWQSSQIRWDYSTVTDTSVAGSCPRLGPVLEAIADSCPSMKTFTLGLSNK